MRLISWNLTLKIANLAIFFIVSIKVLRQSLSPKFHCLHDNVATSPIIDPSDQISHDRASYCMQN